MTSDKTARLLNLLAFLLEHHYPVTREQIFERVRGYVDHPDDAEATDLESARRMFERDKDDLRNLGILIETVQLPEAAHDEASAGYRLRPANFYLPYLELAPSGSTATVPGLRGLARIQVTKGELELLDRATRKVAELDRSPLAQAASEVRRKLEFDLPLSQGAIDRLLAPTLTRAAERTLEVLQEAVSSQTAVRCEYYAIGHDERRERILEPYGIFFTWGRWYAVGRARDRDAVRVFRVDRMSEARLLKRDTFEVPASFRLEEFLHRAPWELSTRPPSRAVVRFEFPESRSVLAREIGAPVEPTLEDGAAIIAFEVREPQSFLRWLLTFRGRARLLEPEHLKQELMNLRSKVLSLYAERSQ